MVRVSFDLDDAVLARAKDAVAGQREAVINSDNGSFVANYCIRHLEELTAAFEAANPVVAQAPQQTEQPQPEVPQTPSVEVPVTPEAPVEQPVAPEQPVATEPTPNVETPAPAVEPTESV